MEYQEIFEPLEVLDALGGEITGNYEYDRDLVERIYNKTFALPIYLAALQISENP